VFRDKMIEKIDEEIAKLEAIKTDLDWLPDIPAGQAILTTDNRVRIALPFDRCLMKQMPEVMAEYGLELYQNKLEEDTSWYPYQNFVLVVDGERQYDKQIEVCYFDWIEGSICKKRWIGKTTKEVDVYEFSCEEA
jgi:hypothetical protein